MRLHRPVIAVVLATAAAGLASVHAAEPASAAKPIIDMHLHAFRMEELPPGAPACPGSQHVLIPTIDPKDELEIGRASCRERVL